MKKYLRSLFIFLFFVALASSSYAVENKQAPAFQLTDLNGKVVFLSDYKDKQAVILFFWTTWCPFCREELKRLNQEYAGLTKDAIEVLAIDVGESKSKVDNFVKTRNLTFKVLLDKDNTVADAYELMGVPTYIVINKSGQVVSTSNNFPKDTLKELANK
ncbi:MAG: redoxin domain-containing protein [Candidatus Omnitrophota bacterium]|nr:redoxin domain-containing protein [Candidatus Omnitrophota bacterium]